MGDRDNVISFSDAKDRADGFYRAKSCALKPRHGSVFLELDFESGEGFSIRLTPDEARLWSRALVRVARAAVARSR